MTKDTSRTKHPRIPTCTYRLQFNRWFTFAQAGEIVAYLHELGVSDAYASPYFQARADSLHGYDITDHNKLNPAIGSRADYDAWIAELHVRFDAGAFTLHYHNHVLPIAPGTYRYILEVALENLSEYKEENFYAEF